MRELHEHTSDEFEVDMTQEIPSPKEKSPKTVDPKETTGQEKSGNEEEKVEHKKVEHESYERKEVKEALLLALSETNVSQNGEPVETLEEADLRTAGELELPEMETQEPRNQFLASCFSLCHIRFRV